MMMKRRSHWVSDVGAFFISEKGSEDIRRDILTKHSTHIEYRWICKTTLCVIGVRGGERVMSIRDEAFADWKKKMKYKDIAEKYGVSESTVKSWASRYWKKGKKVATKKKKKSQPRGAPKGNRNACGNEGGAPIGNDNATKHGGYSKIYWDTLTDEEKDLIDTMPKSEEDLLLDQIRFFSIRERRILQAIDKLKSSAVNDKVLNYTTESKTVRVFANEEDRKLYEERIKSEVASGKRKPGETVSILTSTENVQNAVSRLEDELTRVQRAKTQAISTLARLNIEKQKLDMLKEKDDVEVEDTSETDDMIYGQDIPQETNDTV